MATNAVIALNPNLGNKCRSASAIALGVRRLFTPDRFISAVMPMHVVRPRPNSDVAGSISYDHNGYVGLETTIPITIQGGAFPFVYTIIEAPEGASINNDPSSRQYGNFKWTPTSEGIYDIKIVAIDQDKTERIISWSINVNSNWIVFAGNGGSNTYPGTMAQPFATITHAFSVTTGGKVLCLLDGTFTDLNGSRTMSASTINGIIARNPRAATIDCNSWVSTNSVVFWLNNNNTIIQGVKFLNPPTTGDNPRWFSVSNACNNSFMHNCDFDINGRFGTNNGDNISCFFFSDLGPSTQRRNIAQTECDFRRFAGNNGGAGFNGWSSIDVYTTRNAVIERCKFYDQVSSTTIGGMLWIKASDNRNLSIRQNEWVTPMSGRLLDLSMSNRLGDDRCGNIEVCYNIVRCNNQNEGIEVLSGSGAGRRLPVWSYRNTIINGTIKIHSRSDAPLAFTSINDVIINDQNEGEPWRIIGFNSTLGDPITPVAALTAVTASITGYECHLPTSANALNAAGELINQYAVHTGILGHKISH